MDPVTNASVSAFAVFEGNPIWKIDIKGDDPSTFTSEKGTVVGGTTKDNDKGVYSVPGLKSENFDESKTEQYKKEGRKIGSTISLYSFKAPEDGKWRGQIYFNNEAENNVSIATQRLGNFMKIIQREIF